MSENKVEVAIDGVSYTLITEEDESQIHEIASYVEKKIAEAKSQRLSYDKELVLTSLNIANDLYHVGNKYKALRDENQEAIEKYPGLVDNYNKAIDQNEELIAKVEELIEKNKASMAEIDDLNRKVKAGEETDKTMEKLRAEIKRLQQEVVTLRSENDQLKDKI